MTFDFVSKGRADCRDGTDAFDDDTLTSKIAAWGSKFGISRSLTLRSESGKCNPTSRWTRNRKRPQNRYLALNGAFD